VQPGYWGVLAALATLAAAALLDGATAVGVGFAAALALISWVVISDCRAAIGAVLSALAHTTSGERGVALEGLDSVPSGPLDELDAHQGPWRRARPGQLGRERQSLPGRGHKPLSAPQADGS
jgi:hypothetical protein